MLWFKDERFVHSILNTPFTVWLILTAEFWLSFLVSGFLTVLELFRSILPKPPRDLTGDVVLIAGASSTLGSLLAREFSTAGCSLILLDKDLRTVQEDSSQPPPGHRGILLRKEPLDTRIKGTSAYSCDLENREDIRRVAREVLKKERRIDVLVTCVGRRNQDVFETANRTLMSHYWTVMAFLPSMMEQGRGHVIGVTPVASINDVYLSSRIAIASLMESLGRELGDRSGQFTFLSISPVADPSSMEDKERQVARDVVQAVRRDQSSANVSWISRFLYSLSCTIHNRLTAIARWVDRQGCEL